MAICGTEIENYSNWNIAVECLIRSAVHIRHARDLDQLLPKFDPQLKLN